MSRPSIVLVVVFAAWLVFLVLPMVVYWAWWLVFIAFLGTIGWSAVRPGSTGRWSGLFFVLLLAILPLWVLSGYALYCWTIGVNAFGPEIGR